MLENLRSELVGKEMSFANLDNYMMGKGYLSVFDDGITEDVKQDLNVVYTKQYDDFAQAEVKITFEITLDNGSNEAEEAFDLLVSNIEEF